ncbi:MAG: hypothetical protein OJF49_003468 [Ktedonobacterales bacterium]|jgi:hypothetical protein|nr:MAG: hypothetical protein OJF49_003468 [Ktedonobacterales bacterium]
MESNAIVVLALRVGLVAILYLVILQIVAVSRRDMRLANAAPPATTAARPVVGYLVVVDSGSTHLVPGSRFPIEPITTIGRGPTNSIVVDTTFASTEHTRILFRDQSLWVEDMDSRNGTFVDQRQVTTRVAVTPGSILQVGDVRFKFAPLDGQKGGR